MAQQLQMLAMKPDTWIQSPSLTRWKERSNFCRFPLMSTCAPCHVCIPPTHRIRQRKWKKNKNLSLENLNGRLWSWSLTLLMIDQFRKHLLHLEDQKTAGMNHQPIACSSQTVLSVFEAEVQMCLVCVVCVCGMCVEERSWHAVLPYFLHLIFLRFFEILLARLARKLYLSPSPSAGLTNAVPTFLAFMANTLPAEPSPLKGESES